MIPIIDMHADVLMDLARNSATNGPSKENSLIEKFSNHVARMRKGRISAAVVVDCRMAGESAGEEHLQMFIDIVQMLKHHEGAEYQFVRNASELEKAMQSGLWAGIACFEGLTATGGNLKWLQQLYDQAEMRIASLTHNYDNMFGGGALGQDKSLGLTSLGREAVSTMNELGILIDMAHASPVTRRDIIEHSNKPVMLSHTSSKSVYDNGRNLSDSEMKLIAEHGGLIGCMTSPAALADIKDFKHHSLQRYMEHLLHMINVAGEDHVGLGLHFCEYLYTEEEYPPVTGLEDASVAYRIIDELFYAGLSERVIEKIAWRNFMNIFSEACG